MLMLTTSAFLPGLGHVKCQVSLDSHFFYPMLCRFPLLIWCLSLRRYYLFFLILTGNRRPAGGSYDCRWYCTLHSRVISHRWFLCGVICPWPLGEALASPSFASLTPCCSVSTCDPMRHMVHYSLSLIVSTCDPMRHMVCYCGLLIVFYL